MSNTEFNSPDFYAIYCVNGRSYFYRGGRHESEVLKFHSMADREEYIDRTNAAHSSQLDPVAWAVTAEEAAQYVNLDCYSLNNCDEVYRTATGLSLFHYNARQIF